MPSFSEIVGIVITFIVLSVTSGHGDYVWKTITEVRKIATKDIKSDWGCPSIFNDAACRNYDSQRYK